jgi:hypothetical protein
MATRAHRRGSDLRIGVHVAGWRGTFVAAEEQYDRIGISRELRDEIEAAVNDAIERASAGRDLSIVIHVVQR